MHMYKQVVLVHLVDSISLFLELKNVIILPSLLQKSQVRTKTTEFINVDFI